MSNNLGQIYATSKSADKYIVLDSENVEVSGNFYINGTNSRMPAEFENSIRDYLPLTYGTTDSNATTLFEKFDDLSQNVLKQRKDASFNNVDISGNLIVKGSLGILDSSTNDISYGNAGAVLTSNGSGSPVSWNAPYYFRAYCDEDIDSVPENTEEVISNFLVNSDATSSNASSDLSGETTWTPPAGIYMINLQAGVSRVPAGNIFEIRLYLRKNGTIIRLTRMNNDDGSSGSDTIYQSVNMSDIIHVDEGDEFDFVLYVSIVGSGSTYTIRGDSNGQQTFFSAYKIA